MPDDSVTFMLANIARQLALLPTDDVEKHVRECEESLERFDGFAPLFDPSAWMRSNANGETEDARNQLAIAKHLLAARKAIDDRERFAATKRCPPPHRTP